MSLHIEHVALGETVTFRGDTHTKGDRMRDRVGRIVAYELPDGEHRQLAVPTRNSYSGGYCWDHREAVNGRFHPTRPYYTIDTPTHTFGICECRLVAATVTLF